MRKSLRQDGEEERRKEREGGERKESRREKRGHLMRLVEVVDEQHSVGASVVHWDSSRSADLRPHQSHQASTRLK